MQCKAHTIIIALLFGLSAACGSGAEPQFGQTVAPLFTGAARAQVPVSPAQIAGHGRTDASDTDHISDRPCPRPTEAATTGHWRALKSRDSKASIV